MFILIFLELYPKVFNIAKSISLLDMTKLLIVKIPKHETAISIYAKKEYSIFSILIAEIRSEYSVSHFLKNI